VNRPGAAVLATLWMCCACSGSSPAPSSSTTPPTSGGVASGAVVVTSIEISGHSPPLKTSSQFAAVAHLSDGTAPNVAAQATWQSSNNAVATVSSTGMVTAVAQGLVEIRATYFNVTGTLTFEVGGPTPFTLRGTVTDNTTGRILTNAFVGAHDTNGGASLAQTDSLGRYTLSLPRGTVTLSVGATGYLDMAQTIVLLADTTLDFRLMPVAVCPTVTFDEFKAFGAPFTVSTACGWTVTATTPNWTVNTVLGTPPPSIQFVSSAGSALAGEITVAAAGRRFTFQSIDLSSTTAAVSYALTGSVNSATTVDMQGTLGNTAGSFVTISNAQPTAPLDRLVIHLSTVAAACCTNSVALDNIRAAF